MEDTDKVKEQLMNELVQLRKRIAELENPKTKHRKAEKELLDNEEGYRAMVESSINGIVIVQELKIMYLNPAALHMFGYKDANEIAGREFTELVSPEFRDIMISKGFARISGADACGHFEFKALRKDDTSFDAELSVSLINYKDKAALQVTLKDITERKEAERAFRETKDKLEAAYAELHATQAQLIQAEKFKAIGQLASGVAHEVKNPLGILLQDINFLEKNLSKNKEFSEILDMMKKNVKRADSIVRVLVDFSRASELSMESEDINSIIENSLILMQHKSELENVEFIKELKENLPKVLVDKGKAEQVFLNIFLNAIQAMPNGGKLIIRSYLTELNKVGNGVGRRRADHFSLGDKAVVVEIEDTGIGISKENLKRIFEPFFTTKEVGKGTGLGLSVIRNIIDMHRGLINIESEEGKGTKVIITLKISAGGT